MATDLAVWLHRQRVGTLYLTDGRMTFRYTDAALASSQVPALSISLPKRAEPFNDFEARPYFAGLLPEGRLRDLIGARLQVSRQNEFGLLREIGGECAGAVSITAGEPPRNSPSETRWLDEEELEAVIDEIPRRPMMAGVDGLRLSLAGAQDKLPVVFDGWKVGLPMHGSPSTHILKSPIAGVSGSVINEAFCMSLAKATGYSVADVAVFQAGRHEVLLVERYDRLSRGGVPSRLHQEDFCQALGVVSNLKYQSEGGPGFKEAFGLIRTATSPSVINLLNLLDYAIFNTLVGNHDAHGKNYSLLYLEGGQPSLAPLYDVLCTVIYPDLTPKMAMKIGGKYRFTELHDKHWYRFAEEVGMSKAQVRHRVIETANQLPNKARELAQSPDGAFLGNMVVNRIVEAIEHRCALTLKRLEQLPVKAPRL